MLLSEHLLCFFIKNNKFIVAKEWRRSPDLIYHPKMFALFQKPVCPVQSIRHWTRGGGGGGRGRRKDKREGLGRRGEVEGGGGERMQR